MSSATTENKTDVFENQALEVLMETGLDLAGADMIAKTYSPTGVVSNHAVTIEDETAGDVLLTFAIKRNALTQISNVIQIFSNKCDDIFS